VLATSDDTMKEDTRFLISCINA